METLVKEVAPQIKADITYRQASVFDISIITLLWLDMVKEVQQPWTVPQDQDIRAFAFTLSDRMRQPEFFTEVALAENKIIGFIHGGIQVTEYEPPRLRGHCDHLYVKPAYRGNEIGPELIERLRERGVPHNVKVHEFRTPFDMKMIKRWERMGYKPCTIVYRKEED